MGKPVPPLVGYFAQPQGSPILSFCFPLPSLHGAQLQIEYAGQLGGAVDRDDPLPFQKFIHDRISESSLPSQSVGRKPALQARAFELFFQIDHTFNDIRYRISCQ